MLKQIRIDNIKILCVQNPRLTAAVSRNLPEDIPSNDYGQQFTLKVMFDQLPDDMKKGITLDDLKDDPVVTNFCNNCLNLVHNSNRIKQHRRLKELPSEKAVQQPGSFKAQLQKLSNNFVNQNQFNTLLRRVCLKAAQNGQTEVHFLLGAWRVTHFAGHINPEEERYTDDEELTLELLSALYPKTFHLLDNQPSSYEETKRCLSVFIRQLEMFAIQEQFQFYSNPREQAGHTYEIDIRISWNPTVSFNDAIVISNHAAKVDTVKKLLEKKDGHDWISRCLSAYIPLLE